MADGNWEDNWLFKKKSSSLTTSMTGSVGMLVPAPKDDVRAQIGDKTADEISDLSEMGSDTDDSSAKPDEDLNPLNDRILNKHLIGGQNTGVILDELMETASLISTTSHSQDEPKFTEATNERIINIALKYESVDTKADAKYNDPKPEPVCDSLSAPMQSNDEIEDESDCLGISSVEMFELNPSGHESRSISQGPSVIEILAAVALGPMLAVPATHRSLDVIDEEEEARNLMEIIHNPENQCFNRRSRINKGPSVIENKLHLTQVSPPSQRPFLSTSSENSERRRMKKKISIRQTNIKPAQELTQKEQHGAENHEIGLSQAGTETSNNKPPLSESENSPNKPKEGAAIESKEPAEENRDADEEPAIRSESQLIQEALQTNETEQQPSPHYGKKIEKSELSKIENSCSKGEEGAAIELKDSVQLAAQVHQENLLVSENEQEKQLIETKQNRPQSHKLLRETRGTTNKSNRALSHPAEGNEVESNETASPLPENTEQLTSSPENLIVSEIEQEKELNETKQESTTEPHATVKDEQEKQGSEAVVVVKAESDVRPEALKTNQTELSPSPAEGNEVEKQLSEGENSCSKEQEKSALELEESVPLPAQVHQENLIVSEIGQEKQQNETNEESTTEPQATVEDEQEKQGTLSSPAEGNEVESNETASPLPENTEQLSEGENSCSKEQEKSALELEESVPLPAQVHQENLIVSEIGQEKQQNETNQESTTEPQATVEDDQEKQGSEAVVVVKAESDVRPEALQTNQTELSPSPAEGNEVESNETASPLPENTEQLPEGENSCSKEQEGSAIELEESVQLTAQVHQENLIVSEIGQEKELNETKQESTTEPQATVEDDQEKQADSDVRPEALKTNQTELSPSPAEGNEVESNETASPLPENTEQLSEGENSCSKEQEESALELEESVPLSAQVHQENLIVSEIGQEKQLNETNEESTTEPQATVEDEQEKQGSEGVVVVKAESDVRPEALKTNQTELSPSPAEGNEVESNETASPLPENTEQLSEGENSCSKEQEESALELEESVQLTAQVHQENLLVSEIGQEKELNETKQESTTEPQATVGDEQEKQGSEAVVVVKAESDVRPEALQTNQTELSPSPAEGNEVESNETASPLPENTEQLSEAQVHQENLIVSEIEQEKQLNETNEESTTEPQATVEDDQEKQGSEAVVVVKADQTTSSPENLIVSEIEQEKEQNETKQESTTEPHATVKDEQEKQGSEGVVVVKAESDVRPEALQTNQTELSPSPAEGNEVESNETASPLPENTEQLSEGKSNSLRNRARKTTNETNEESTTEPQATVEDDQEKQGSEAVVVVKADSDVRPEALQTNQTELSPSPAEGNEVESNETALPLPENTDSCRKLTAQVHQENLLVSEIGQEKELNETKQESTTEPQATVEDDQEKQGSEAVVVVKADSDVRPEALKTNQTELSPSPAEGNEVESNETASPLPENTEQLSEGENSCSKEQEESALELEESVPLPAQVHQENLIVSEIGQEKQLNETNEEDEQEKQGSEGVVVVKAESDVRPEALKTNQTELSPSPAEGNEVESNETASPLPENTEQLKEQEESALELEESVQLTAQVHQENLLVSEIGQEKELNETKQESTTEPQATVGDEQEKQGSEAVVVVKAESDVRPEALQTNQTELSPSPAEGNEVESNETASPLPENTEQLSEGENSCSKEQEKSALELEESVPLPAQVHQENLIVSEIEQEKQQNETNEEDDQEKQGSEAVVVVKADSDVRPEALQTNQTELSPSPAEGNEVESNETASPLPENTEQLPEEPQATVGDEQEKQGSEAVVVVKAESDVRPEALQTNQTELSPSPAEGNEVESNETASPLPENTEQLSKLPAEVHQEKLIVSEIEQEKELNETKQESTTEPQATVGDEQEKQGSEAVVVVKAESDVRPEALQTNQTELSPSPAEGNEVESNETASPLPENTEQLSEAQVHLENLIVSEIEQEKQQNETNEESTTEPQATVEDDQEKQGSEAVVVVKAESDVRPEALQTNQTELSPSPAEGNEVDSNETASPLPENTEQLSEGENSCSKEQEESALELEESVPLPAQVHQENLLVSEIGQEKEQNETKQESTTEPHATVKMSKRNRVVKPPAEGNDVESNETASPLPENTEQLSEGENSCSKEQEKQEKQQNETNQESTTEPQATVGDEQEKQGSEAVVAVKAASDVRPEALPTNQTELSPSPAEVNDVDSNGTALPLPENTEQLPEGENSCCKEQEGSAIELEESVQLTAQVHQENLIVSEIEQERQQNETNQETTTEPQATVGDEQEKQGSEAVVVVKAEPDVRPEALQTNQTELSPSPAEGNEVESNETASPLPENTEQLPEGENSCSKEQEGSAIELEESVQLTAQVHQENLIVSEIEQEKQQNETNQETTTEPQATVGDEQEKQGSEAVVVVKAEPDVRPEALQTNQTELSPSPAEGNEVESNETASPLPENTEQLPEGQEKQQNETNQESTTEPQATVEDEQEKQGSEAVVVVKAESDVRPEALQTNQTELSPSPAEGNDVESNETASPLPENTEQLPEGENSCSKEQEGSAIELEESVQLTAQVHQENLIVSEIEQEKQQNETNKKRPQSHKLL
ncbi:unnamed protein product [Ceratitis capitata]|uniref:(Mediterranean fruit fly) hypothetical protein n=1 Tax=Ceratitis capitata TaxID=7213 RepID=A0A811VHT3_CERCA|nr:unnamed protein product [Ceratitis capitata]